MESSHAVTVIPLLPVSYFIYIYIFYNTFFSPPDIPFPFIPFMYQCIPEAHPSTTYCGATPNPTPATPRTPHMLTTEVRLQTNYPWMGEGGPQHTLLPSSPAAQYYKPSRLGYRGPLQPPSITKANFATVPTLYFGNTTIARPSVYSRQHTPARQVSPSAGWE